jgi:hypothetical protein
MHHFRGSLLDGSQTRLDPANVYLDFHGETPGAADAGWEGYLLVKEERDVEPGKAYTLRLEDGRSGRLTVKELTPEDSEKFKYRATFVGEGQLL